LENIRFRQKTKKRAKKISEVGQRKKTRVKRRGSEYKGGKI